MPRYHLWFVGELRATETSGAPGRQLGVALSERDSFALDAHAWEPVAARVAWEDGAEVLRLDTAQSIGGVALGDGTLLRPEGEVVVSDGSATFTLMALGLADPDAPEVHGLAWFGTEPPVGDALTVLETRPARPEAQPATVLPPCFTSGTKIRTLDGDIPVEWLQIGDRVITRDHGAQPLRWAGYIHYARWKLAKTPGARPVAIKAGALGPQKPERDMLIAPHHRLLMRAAEAEAVFGNREVFVAAHHLIDGAQVTEAQRLRDVTYVHLLFDRHEIVYADGVEAESFLPTRAMVGAFDDVAQRALLSQRPELGAAEGAAMEAARPTLSGWEARMLSATALAPMSTAVA